MSVLISRLAQSLAIPDGNVLRTTIAVMNKGVSTFWLSFVQSLLQRIAHKVCPHAAALTPTRNPTCIYVNHKDRVLPALPRRDVGEVQHPQLIGSAQHLDLRLQRFNALTLVAAQAIPTSLAIFRCLTQSSSVCGTHPILGAIDSMQAQRDGCSPYALAPSEQRVRRPWVKNDFFLVHGSIFSKFGASSKNGAIQCLRQV
jgi:hypothetical protein